MPTQQHSSFVDEVYYRTESAKKALFLFSKYKRYKSKNLNEVEEIASLTHILPRFALLELATLLDSQGGLSVSKNAKGVYLVQKTKLKKLLPGWSRQDLDSVLTELNDLFKESTKVVDYIFEKRHSHVAHAKKRSFGTSLSRRFPSARVYIFASRLGSIFLRRVFLP